MLEEEKYIFIVRMIPWYWNPHLSFEGLFFLNRKIYHSWRYDDVPKNRQYISQLVLWKSLDAFSCDIFQYPQQARHRNINYLHIFHESFLQNVWRRVKRLKATERPLICISNTRMLAENFYYCLSHMPWGLILLDMYRVELNALNICAISIGLFWWHFCSIQAFDFLIDVLYLNL